MTIKNIKVHYENTKYEYFCLQSVLILNINQPADQCRKFCKNFKSSKKIKINKSNIFRKKCLCNFLYSFDDFNLLDDDMIDRKPCVTQY